MEITRQCASFYPATALVSVFLYISWSIRKHQSQCYVIHTPKDVMNTPSGGSSNLPYYAEGAMGTLIYGL
ncbi:MAG: hypothetical protein ACI4TM_05890 [Candidatus Cryptobacteroides sp.]